MRLIKNTGSDRVFDELRQSLVPPSSLDLASPAFSLFAFAELRDLLEKLDACRVVLLVPKRLRDNWTLYKANDRRNFLASDRFNYDVLNHTDLSRDGGTSGDIDLAHLNWGNYDLTASTPTPGSSATSLFCAPRRKRKSRSITAWN